MKVIENNYEGEHLKEREIDCPHCNSKLKYTSKDVRGIDNSFLLCPCCEQEFSIEPLYQCPECMKEYTAKSYIGIDGGEYVSCPDCGCERYVSEGITITPDNLSFPKHFYHCKSPDAIEVPAFNVEMMAKQCLKSLDKEHDYAFCSTGNAFIIAVKDNQGDNDVLVLVCPNYYVLNTTIPEEKF